VIVNEPMMDLFEFGDDVMIEFVELPGAVDPADSPAMIDFSETPEGGADASAMDAGLEGESDGVGARNPAPKGDGVGPSVRP
jgi:hypothetical protein